MAPCNIVNNTGVAKEHTEPSSFILMLEVAISSEILVAMCQNI